MGMDRGTVFDEARATVPSAEHQEFLQLSRNYRSTYCLFGLLLKFSISTIQ